METSETAAVPLCRQCGGVIKGNYGSLCEDCWVGIQSPTSRVVTVLLRPLRIADIDTTRAPSIGGRSF